MNYSFLNWQELWKHKLLHFYIRTPIHPSKLRLARWLQSLLGLDDVLCKTDSGISMLLYPWDHVQQEILYHDAYEQETLQLIRALLQEGDYFLDVGSHIGFFSLEAAKVVGYSGKVFTFEANPKTFAKLLINIDLNKNNFKNIYPVLAAVSDSTGSIASMKLPPDNNWGLSKQTIVEDDQCFAIPTISLEYFLDFNSKPNNVNLVKIDVEGFELNVLKGLLNSNYYLPNNIIFEYEPNYFPNAKNAAKYLLSKSYHLHDVMGKPYDIENPTPLINSNLWAKRKDS